MKSYLFDEEINKDSVDRLIAAINDGAEVIYIRSDGGEIDFVEVVATELLRANCILIAFGYLMSAALSLFASYKGTKTIVPGLNVAIHFPTYDIDIRSTLGKSIRGVHDNYELFQKESYSSLCNEWGSKLRGMNVPDEMLDHLKDGKTIYMDWNQVEKLNLGPSFVVYEDVLTFDDTPESSSQDFIETFNGLLDIRDKAIAGVSYEEITCILKNYCDYIRIKYIN